MTNKSRHIAEILKLIPEEPGVYQYFDNEGTVIYVGKAKNLRRRVSSYFQKEHDWIKTRQLVKKIDDIKYVVVKNEQDAFLLENNLIKQYQPYYNILLKDGKSYPSICITKEDFPRIFKTRKIIKGAGEYYGPYSYGNTVDLVLEFIHRICPVRTCSQSVTHDGVRKGKYKTCLKYHLKTCCGICENKATEDEYRRYVDYARQIIKGDARLLETDLKIQMTAYAEKFEYEKAQDIKEQLELLDKFCSKTVVTNTSSGDIDAVGYAEEGDSVFISMLHTHHGSIVQGQTIEYHKRIEETREEILALGIYELREQLHSTTNEIVVPFIPDFIGENIHLHIALSGDKKRLLNLAQQNVEQYRKDNLKQRDKLNPDQRAARILGKLKALLDLPKTPVFIDSFDNSNLQGSDAVAGCVVFKKAKPSKKDYKRFIIKTVDGIDDYASMREIVRRRYSDLIDENKELPDLIIADGGVGQMEAIREVVERQLGLNIPVAGLKKDSKHRTNVLLYGNPPQEYGMKITDEVFRLLVEIQDEVHRFAVSYHKNKRSKTQTRSELDDIKGVGTVAKSKILNRFHSVARAKEASLEELQKLLGNHTGTVVYEYFKSNLS